MRLGRLEPASIKMLVMAVMVPSSAQCMPSHRTVGMSLLAGERVDNTRCICVS